MPPKPSGGKNGELQTIHLFFEKPTVPGRNGILKSNNCSKSLDLRTWTKDFLVGELKNSINDVNTSICTCEGKASQSQEGGNKKTNPDQKSTYKNESCHLTTAVRTLFWSIHHRSSSKSNMITSDSISSFYLLVFDTSASIYPFSSDLWPPTESSWIIHRYNPTPQHQCPRNLFGSFIGRRWRAIKHRTLDPRRSGSQKVDPMIPQTGYIWSGQLQLEKPRIIMHGSNHCKDCQSLCFHMVWNIFVPLKLITAVLYGANM